jgi:hypothetical protein
MKDTSKLPIFQNIHVKILFTNRLSKKSLKKEKIFIKKNPTRCKNISIFLLLLFHIFPKLNMFQATHRPSSGA